MLAKVGKRVNMETTAWLVERTLNRWCWRIRSVLSLHHVHAGIVGEEAAFGHRMHISKIFGAYLGNCASKGREVALQGLLASGSAKRLAKNVVAVEQPHVMLGGAVQRLNKAEICSQGLQPACTLRVARNACMVLGWNSDQFPSTSLQRQDRSRITLPKLLSSSCL